MIMNYALILSAVLVCVVKPCTADEIRVTIDSGRGLKPISYGVAAKKIHFHILLPQGWHAEDCVVYPNWIKQENSITGNDPGPRLPSRQAVGVAKKGDQSRLILESPYINNLSVYNNRQGMLWIVSAGYFTKDLNNSRLGGFCVGRRGGTSYAILNSSSGKLSNNHFEHSLR